MSARKSYMYVSNTGSSATSQTVLEIGHFIEKL